VVLEKDAVVVTNVVASALLAHPRNAPDLLWAIAEKRKHLPGRLPLPFRQGCIIGLLKGAGNGTLNNWKECEQGLMDLFFTLVWVEDSGDEFSGKASTELSDAVAMYLHWIRNNFNSARAVALRLFLKRVVEHRRKREDWPSPGAEQVINEIKYKFVGISDITQVLADMEEDLRRHQKAEPILS
jgi:hypothetical protein